ncbi:DUF3304 domain-containing protein [Pseudomonas xionganensis]|uniref:DUF3304 domain-containing protein n=1 Tax=Pseudomonas xionganensis TaxID=2654845 RepID=A0A6I4KVZ8_9PSED|nr:DUF3304 domain-containing protein [Pseudomonas xionganensis]MVW73973.1 DUF3304 domain-containing protein [Pseudomonas xionganensis]
MYKPLTAPKRSRWVALFALLLGSLTITACTAQTPQRLGAPIEGYNHTSAAINHFSVNGSGGANINPHSGGGQTCCASLPVKWRPGMTVVVEWEKDPNVGASKYWPTPRYSEAWHKAAAAHRAQYTRHRAVVEVAPYERLGVVNVHFLPCNQIKVAAGTDTLRMPSHPYHYLLNMEEPSQCTNQ